MNDLPSWMVELSSKGVVEEWMLGDMADSYGTTVEQLLQLGVKVGMPHSSFGLIRSLDLTVAPDKQLGLD